MYIQKFYLKPSAIFLSIIFLCASLLSATSVWALSTDKDQAIEIEANNADLDDEKGITIYRGNVILIQGSVRMTGDLLTVYFKDEKLDTLIMEGKPARYKQLPDDSKVYDEAEALRIEYYEFKNLAVLIDQASFEQENMSFDGNRIEYDTEHSKVKIKGGVKQKSTETSKPNERVKIIHKPQKEKKQE